MKLYLFLSCLVFTCFCFAQPAPSTQESKDKIDYRESQRMINIWMDAQKDFDKLKGISVTVIKDQQIIFNKGYGTSNIETGGTTQLNTIYSICSISKLFTSVAIMQLWEQGKIRLDDSITALLPNLGLTQKFPESGPITIRSLLTHSAGFPRESDFPYWTEFKFPDDQQITQKLKTQETLYPASTYLQYSNLGMTILGQVVAKISGMSYEKYVEENIVKPLRLANTRPSMPKELWGKQLAIGYSSLYRDGNRKPLPYFNANGIAPAAGFSSTAEDLALFAAWQFRLLKNGGKEILKASTLREMQRVHWLDPDWKNSWGLGFVIYQLDGKTYTGHDGSCPGYQSVLQMDMKDKLGVVLMSNSQGNDMGIYTDGIFSIIQKAKPAMTVTDSLNLEQYAGYYDNYAWRGEIVIMPWQGKLAMFGLPNTDPGKNMSLFIPSGKDVFRRVRADNTLGEELRFERDAAGTIIKYWRHSNKYDKLKKVLPLN